MPGPGENTSPPTGQQTPPPVPLATDELTLDWAADDWGDLVHNRPFAVLQPNTVADIVATLSWAQGQQVPCLARGQGHSLHGQAQSTDGIVIDMRPLNTIHEIGADHVVVDTGARWIEVLRATLKHGLTPAVLTDYLQLTVGGTLSAGGIGGTTQHHGLQTDNVRALEVLTPDGKLHTCSPNQNTALFDAARAGQGQHGIMTHAAIGLIPAPTHVQRHKFHFRDVSAFLAHQRHLVGRFDYLEGLAQPDLNGDFHYTLDVGRFHSSDEGPDPDELLDELARADTSAEVEDVPYFDFLNAMAPQEEFLRSHGSWYHPHPWINVFLPDTATDDVVTTTMSELTAADLGEFGLVLLYPFPTHTITTPGFAKPNEPLAFLLALLRTAAPDDDAALNRMLTGNQTLRERTFAAGGTVYLEPNRSFSDQAEWHS